MAYVIAHNSRTGGPNLTNLLLLKSVINSAHFNVDIMSLLAAEQKLQFFTLN